MKSVNFIFNLFCCIYYMLFLSNFLSIIFDEHGLQRAGLSEPRLDSKLWPRPFPRWPLYVPAAGGTVLVRNNPESATSTTTRLVFYGSAAFQTGRATYTPDVKICTPLTIDAAGNIYFGFVTFGANMDRALIGAAKVVSGLARVTPSRSRHLEAMHGHRE